MRRQRFFFGGIVEKITSHVEGLLRDPKLAKCEYLFMVGGFSESRLLQNEMKKRFSKRLFIPSDTQLAVLKGAVLFGHYPTEITSRIARKTYGYGTNAVFDPKIHEPARQFTGACGEVRCKT